MNFINRAFKNVTRKMSKTILLLLTFFLIGNLVIIGLGVSNAANNAKILTRKKMRAVVKIGVDYDAVWKYAESLEDEDAINEFYKHYPTVKVSDVYDLLKDERVTTANATNINTVYAAKDSTIDFVHLNNQREQEMDNEEANSYCYYDEVQGTVCTKYETPIVCLKANFFPSMIELEDGTFVVTDGRFYNKEEIESGAQVCLVTEEFAMVNGLSVGSHVQFSIYQDSEIKRWGEGITEEDNIIDLEVIGIYSHTNHIYPDSNQFNWTEPYENPDNMLLVPGYTFAMASLPMNQKQFDYYKEQYPDEEYYSDINNYPSLETIKSGGIGEAVLLLNDPLEVDKFVEQHKSSLSEFIKMSADNDEFKRLSKPLDTLSLYANFIIWLVVINAIVIITLVTALTLKTREYEIGVLLSIGASKLKVISQFFVELAIVAILGFSLAIVSGSLVASKVGETVLNYQITESGVNEDGDDIIWDDGYINIWDNDYTTDITLDDLLSEYNVSVSPVIIAEIYVCGLAIVFISIIIPSMMIIRFNPKKILMNQN